MKYVTFSKDGQVAPGVLIDRLVYPLSVFGYPAKTLEAFVAASDGSESTHIRASLPVSGGIALSEVQLLAPIPEPLQEIIIMQNNYQPTVKETTVLRARAASGELLPTYYYKKATYATTDGDTIPRYEGFLEQLDVQAELCAVLGASVSRCPEAEAHRHIFGYVVINNVIAHDVTLRHRRPYLSTGLDGFLPMSAYLVSADEFAPGHCFRIRSYVNGQLCQDGCTDERIFSPEYAIADLSQASVLCGASILSTGAPFGTLRDHELPYLKRGDVVRCEVDGVGSVSNIIR